MARIIYAVAGEGFGHSTRAHLIGQRLMDAGHDLMFVGSQKSLLYLRQYFGERVKEVFGLSFAYDRGYVDPLKTVKKNALRFPKGHRLNRTLYREHFDPFEPDLVITDFEPFCGWWAWRNRVPFISVDHEHLVNVCRLEHKARNAFSRFTASVVARGHYVGPDAYVVMNFFRTGLRYRSAVLAPPVVRPILTTLSPTMGDHIVMYSTTGTHEARLVGALSKFPGQRFIIYGFNKNQERGNCLFKARSTEGFLRDLAGSRGVIASAGFSLISECMYLRKKMFLLPLAGQYEQIVNAHYIQKLGLGVSARRLNERTLGRFLMQLDSPIPSSDMILWPDNEAFFDTLQRTFDGLGYPVSLSA